MITVPAYTSSLTDRTSVYATVSGQTQMDCVVDTTIVGNIQVEPNWNKTGVGGNSIYFAHTINNLSATAAIRLYAIGTQPLWPITYWHDFNGNGLYDAGTDIQMAYDSNGDGDFSDLGDSVAPAYDTDSDLYPDTGPLDSITTYYLILDVAMPIGPTQGTLDTILLHGVYSAQIQDTATDLLTAMPRIAIEPDFIGTNRKYGSKGNSTLFSHVVTNSANSSDRRRSYVHFDGKHGHAPRPLHRGVLDG